MNLNKIDKNSELKYTYSYDNGGNITCKRQFNSTGILTATTNYGYSDSYWKDQKITEYNQLENTTSVKNVKYTYDEKGASGMSVNNVSYYFVRNIFGDVTAIYDESRNKKAEYSYDAWGTCYMPVNVDGIGSLNPFRYRGYYFVPQIGLYYLTTRFYDYMTGRFVNADVPSICIDDGLTVPEGCNLYSYCFNNPVNFTDSTGQFAVGIFLALAAVFLFTPVGGVVAQTAVSAVSYVGMAIASIWDADIRADMNAIGWNPFNSSESAVLGSNKVSFYKGAPVFLKNGGRSGSFYAISLNKNRNADTLRHEWGHNVQAMIMGPGNYGLTVGIMSPLILGKHKGWDGVNYYNSPWETMADVFGGVQGRTHTSAEISRARWYTAIGTLFFPAAYFFLI